MNARQSGLLSRLALNTATLGHNLPGHGAGWPPERVIDECASRGFGGIVFWQRELGGRTAEIGDRTRAAGMQVVGLCRTPYLVGPKAGDDAEVRHCIDVAARLGAPILTVVTGGVEPGSKGLSASRAILTKRLLQAADHAQDAGVKLAIEPLNPVYAGSRTVVTTVAEALAICTDTGHPSLGVAIDMYHVWWDSSLKQTLSGMAGTDTDILGFHLCDWLENTCDILLDRGMMGDGIADLHGIVAAVEAAGYSGAHEVEVFSAGNWWRRDPHEVLDAVVDRYLELC